MIKKKINLEKSLLNITTITPDGNCFFRCLSQFLYQTEEKYKIIRMAIFTYARTNINTISEFQPTVELTNHKFINTHEYIYNMGKNKEWAGDIEMQLATFIFGITIVVYRDYYLDENEEMINDDSYHHLISFNNDNINNDSNPIMLILHENDNHYHLLYFNNNIERDIEIINTDKSKHNLNTIQIKENKENSHFLNESKLTKKFKRDDSPKKEEYESKGTKLTNDQFNEYPDYTLDEDKNFYYHVYVFLKNGL